jgi:hypothetical protein
MKTEETKTEESRKDRVFRHLTNTINRFGPPAHIAVSNHLREISDGRCFNLAKYHTDALIADEAKVETYKFLFNALIKKGGPDYEALRAGMEETKPEQEAITKPRAFKPKTAQGESKVIKAVEVPAATDPLTKAILDVVMPHLDTIKVKAPLDEGRVDEIARGIVEEFRGEFSDHDKFTERVQKAMQNGAFPQERVIDMIDKTVSKLLDGMVRHVQLITPDGTVKPVEELYKSARISASEKCYCDEGMVSNFYVKKTLPIN